MIRSTIFTFFATLMLTACYPTVSSVPPGSKPIQQFIYYLGEKHPSTESIDLYFDEFAIQREFIAIGSLTNVETTRFELDEMKQGFIFRAKSVGADAILFDPLELSFDPDCSRCLRLKARVLRYK
ncbi:MAG: hypothetical protein AAGI23_20850 [Bacteroidota bacterium]